MCIVWKIVRRVFFEMLQKGSPIYHTAKIAVTVTVCLGYPYLVATLTQLIESTFFDKEIMYWKLMIERSFINIFACLLAAITPNLILFSILMIGLTINGCIIAPYLFSKVRSNDFSTNRIYPILVYVLHGTIILGGITLAAWNLKILFETSKQYF